MNKPNFEKPSKGLKKVGYFVKSVAGGRHYKIWHYYIWYKDRWRLVPHKTWLAIAQILVNFHNIQNVWLSEEYELEQD